MLRIRAITASLLLTLFVLSLSAVYSQSEKPTIEEATAILRQGDFEAAAEAYEQIVVREPENSTAWGNLGLAYHSMGEYEKAIPAYEKYEEISPFRQFGAYNLACVYSLMGENDRALDALGRAVEHGFSNVNALDTDTDLANIRDDERFDQYREGVDKNLRPCEYDPKCRELDFWLGEWEVRSPSGATAGTNRIEKAHNGCLIRESYTSASSSFTGTSMNFYDPVSDSWKQTWIDISGVIIYYDGNIKDGAMHYEGTLINKDGSTELSRMLLEPNEDGSVHQLIERSTDGGKSWYVWFDGKYVKQ